MIICSVIKMFKCNMKKCVTSLNNISRCARRGYTSDLHQKKKIVVITGCDSGLGYSLSLKCKQLGFMVVSGCLDLNSEGAKALASNSHVRQLDIRNSETVKSLREEVYAIMDKEDCELYAVVNNAAIMMFGEFEWLTEQQITEHLEVNVMGTFRVAKEFLPLLRKFKGRLINITSHCSLANLPTLSVYGATKAAIQSWSDGLRVEQAKYGVKVITFIPGSLAMQSNLMSRQEKHAKEMENAFSSEQKEFHLDYFKVFNTHLLGLINDKRPLKPIKDDALYDIFTKSLLDKNPKANYKNEPFRYFLYYNLFRITPTSIRDMLVYRFMRLPSFTPHK